MKKSAGILLFRNKEKGIEIFLVHPGGPFWQKKDDGAWSIPKGEMDEDEDALAAAKREFEEETGIACHGNFIRLEPVKQKSGKVVIAWALEMDIDPSAIKSNIFSMEWPPKSGQRKDFPEVDRGAWFDLFSAKQKINTGQQPLIDMLTGHLQRHNP